MPWSDSYFPRSMVNLPQGTRHKAIGIANALLAQGCGEGRAIRIGISQARRWADSPAARRLNRPHRARGSLQ